MPTLRALAFLLAAAAALALAPGARAQDTSPDYFSFIGLCQMPQSTIVTSNTVTITGVDMPTPISVTGTSGTSQYSIGCTGTFTSTAGTILNGQSVCVRHQTPSGSGTQSTQLTVGDFTATFLTSNSAGSCDTTPDPFQFQPQNGVPRSTFIVSTPVMITGLGANAVVNIRASCGGSTCSSSVCGYSIGCTGTFTNNTSQISNGQTLCARVMSGSNFSLPAITAVTVGGVCATFSTFTEARDADPDAFTFIDQTGVPLSTQIVSSPITVTGINDMVTAFASGPADISVGCTGNYVPSDIVNAGDTLCVRQMSAATPATSQDSVVSIGGVSDTFTTTTRDPDYDPNAFAFFDQINVPTATLIMSSPVTITGIDNGAIAKVTGAAGSESSVPCNTTWSTADKPVNNNQTVCVRHTSAAGAGASVATTLTIGAVADTFTTVTTAPGDTDPDPFSFTDVTGVPASTLVTSAPVTITGLGAPATVNVTGPAGSAFSIGCTATFTRDPAPITNGQSVCVRNLSSASFSTRVDAVLTIGTISDIFSSTTVPADTRPDPFAFVDQFDVPQSTTITSAPVTITGINSPATVTVSGTASSQYSVGCTTYTGSSGKISNGQVVCVRHTSSGTPGSSRTTNLSVGGVGASFTSTVGSGGDIPDPFTFLDRIGVAPSSVVVSAPVTITGLSGHPPVTIHGGACGSGSGCGPTNCGYSIGCTGNFTSGSTAINNGETICVRHTASATYGATVDTSIDISGVCDTFSSTTTTARTDPDPFLFTDRVGVPLSSLQTSNTVTITGITSPALVTVGGGGTYGIGCVAPFTTAPGTIYAGQTLCVQHTASAANSVTVNTTLTIGTISDTFSTTTIASGDTTPNAFAFIDVTNRPLSFPQLSNPVTISGINAPTPISVSGAPSSQYSIGCSPTFTNAPATIANNQQVCVRHTTASTPGTTVDTILNVGGVTDTFSSTTVAADVNPDPFAFADQSGVALSSTVTSEAILVTGIDSSAPVSVAGATGSAYSIGCGGVFTSAPGTINPFQTICVRHTASSSFSTDAVTTLTIGNVAGTFTSTTLAADTDPNAFSFADQTGVGLSAAVTSNAVAIGGINAPAPISVSGAATSAYSVGCTATFTSAPGTVANGQTVCVRHTAAATNSTATSTTLRIGTVQATFTSTTAAVSSVAPSVAYAPAPAATVTLTGGSGAISVSSLADGSGAGSAATTTIAGCAISGAGAAAFATPALAPSPLAFVGATGGAGAIGLNCARGAAATSATLTCSETRGAAAPVTRTWPLACPALPAPPPQVFGATFQVTCDGSIVGSSAQTLTLAHNDADENPARYTVQCNVAQSPLVDALLRTMFASDAFVDVLFQSGFE